MKNHKLLLQSTLTVRFALVPVGWDIVIWARKLLQSLVVSTRGSEAKLGLGALSFMFLNHVCFIIKGKLNIKGAADNCPAWEKLTDIGSPTPRPFENHLPCHGNSCWEDGTIKLRGNCRESRGHTNALGKYTVS